MAQVFTRRAELGVKLVLVGIAVLAFAALAWSVAGERSFAPVGEAVAQPIPFSHKHLSDDGIDCRHCHTTVDTAAFAGLPSTRICLGCHAQLYADAPLLQPLRDSAATGRPIAWRRVHVLPDFVFFNHAVHVNKGVTCTECHGHVEQMPLTWRAVRLDMQWCVGCHRDPAPALRQQRLESERRRADCSTCHR